MTISNKNGVMFFEELRSLETELHTLEASRNRHGNAATSRFREFGRSGRRYTRADILNEFGPSVLPAVRSEKFELAVSAEVIALLRYVSAHEDADGKQSRDMLRSS